MNQAQGFPGRTFGRGRFLGSVSRARRTDRSVPLDTLFESEPVSPFRRPAECSAACTSGATRRTRSTHNVAVQPAGIAPARRPVAKAAPGDYTARHLSVLEG